MRMELYEIMRKSCVDALALIPINAPGFKPSISGFDLNCDIGEFEIGSYKSKINFYISDQEHYYSIDYGSDSASYFYGHSKFEAFMAELGVASKLSGHTRVLEFLKIVNRHSSVLYTVNNGDEVQWSKRLRSGYKGIIFKREVFSSIIAMGQADLPIRLPSDGLSDEDFFGDDFYIGVINGVICQIMVNKKCIYRPSYHWWPDEFKRGLISIVDILATEAIRDVDTCGLD